MKNIKEQNQNWFQKHKVTILKAKDNKNKLEIFDNRPLIVEKVEISPRGGVVMWLYDMEVGDSYEVAYRNSEEVFKEWEICNDIKGDRIEYEAINYYME